MLNVRLLDSKLRPPKTRKPFLFGFPSILKRLRGEDEGAFNIGLSRSFPGFGVGLKNDTIYQNLGVTLAGTTTVVLPSTGTFALATTAGKVRCKVYAGGGTSPTVSSIAFTATDGTNTVEFGSFNPAAAVALSATSWIDILVDYILDTVSGATGGGGTAGQLINPGAVKFSFIITMGGTSPTAKADVEIVPLV